MIKRRLGPDQYPLVSRPMLYTFFLILPVFGFFQNVFRPINGVFSAINQFVTDPFHLKTIAPQSSPTPSPTVQTSILTSTPWQPSVITRIQMPSPSIPTSSQPSVTRSPDSSSSVEASSDISTTLVIPMTSSTFMSSSALLPLTSSVAPSSPSATLELPPSPASTINSTPIPTDQPYNSADQSQINTASPASTGLIALGAIAGFAAGILLFVRYTSKRSMDLPAPVISSPQTQFMSRYPLQRTPTPVLLPSGVIHWAGPVVDPSTPSPVMIKVPSEGTLEKSLPKVNLHPESLLSPFEAFREQQDYSHSQQY